MDITYADAVNRLEEFVASACSRAGQDGLTDEEIVRELRRIADDLEKEARR